ncbi:MAG: hypothetical protein IT538_04885 [Variibacter sp.]|nr:hypothetical protein [Variibacter sp.]
MAERLLITNGDVAVDRLRAIGVEATFLAWRDCLQEGPVPGGLLLEALSLIRAQFLAKELGQSLTKVSREFTLRDAALRDHAQRPRIELWFEHDLHDQLQLIQALDFFVSESRTEGLFLVQADDYLGSTPEEALRGLGGITRPVDAQTFDAARRAWAAFTSATPEPLAAFAVAETPALPHLVPALRRFLGELPAVASGLSTTEERILSLLAQGEQSVGELFRGTQAREPARFMGDLSFFRRVDGLGFARNPLIAGLPFRSLRCAEGPSAPAYGTFASARVSLTERGRNALAGRFDHASENAIDRWFGGTHVTPRTMWRRDQNGRLATAPGR